MEYQTEISKRLLYQLNLTQKFDIRNIYCLRDSINNIYKSELYNDNKELFNKIDNKNLICYSLIRSKNANKRIK